MAKRIVTRSLSVPPQQTISRIGNLSRRLFDCSRSFSDRTSEKRTRDRFCRLGRSQRLAVLRGCAMRKDNSPVRSYAKSNQQLLEAFETYLISLNRSASTRRSYLNSAGRLVEVLGSKE